MYKLLMTWDIRQGKESEYFEYVTQEFAPRLIKLGIQPTEAWYTVYGKAPQILAGFVAEERSTIEQLIAGDEWKSLHERLLGFVLNYNHKIVQATGNFQL